jgi:hypothetical protein
MNQVMMWALITFIICFFFRAIPGATWIMLGSLFVFGTAFFLSKVSRRTAGPSGPEKRWRGQPIDLSGPSWPNRVKAWIKGRKRR